MAMKAVYSVGELAKLTGLSRKRILKLLQERGVNLSKDTRPMYVFLSELQRALPELWESLVICEGARPWVRS
jgi:hypothetical protein